MLRKTRCACYRFAKTRSTKAIFMIMLIAQLTLVLLISGCFSPEAGISSGAEAAGEQSEKYAESAEIKAIRCTVFPVCDFARIIAGGKARVEMPTATWADAHTSDPSVAQIKSFIDADLVLTTGEIFEPWIAKLRGVQLKGKLADVSVGVEERSLSHNEDEHESHSGEHHADVDPHIWLSPKNALILTENILEEIVALDNANEEYYRSNAAELAERLRDMDAQLEELRAISEGKTLYFGDKFAFLYLTSEYGFNYESAYIGCGEEAEPSAKKVTQLISDMKRQGSKVVYYDRLSDSKIARQIASEAGAELLPLNSLHKVSKKDFADGVPFTAFMQENIENLKKGLK